MQRNAQGQVNVRQMRHKEKMVTHKETETFKFSKWKDISRDVKGFRTASVVRVSRDQIDILNKRVQIMRLVAKRFQSDHSLLTELLVDIYSVLVET